MARSSVYLGLALIAVGVPMGLVWAHRLSGKLFVGRSESAGDAGDSGGLRRISAALAKRAVARVARGVALRDELCGRAVQLYVREFISDAGFTASSDDDNAVSNPRRDAAGRIQVALIGCNHRTAPVELRERISFTQQQALDAADELRKQGILEEAVVLSTCNRSELYGVPGESGARADRSDGGVFYVVSRRYRARS